MPIGNHCTYITALSNSATSQNVPSCVSEVSLFDRLMLSPIDTVQIITGQTDPLNIQFVLRCLHRTQVAPVTSGWWVPLVIAKNMKQRHIQHSFVNLFGLPCLVNVPWLWLRTIEYDGTESNQPTSENFLFGQPGSKDVSSKVIKQKKFTSCNEILHQSPFIVCPGQTTARKM